MTLADKVAAVKARVADAARRSGRDPDDITLVAVTKAFPPEVIVSALASGVTDVGENRAQELTQKLAVVGRRGRWHFIGPLQTNKVRQVVGHVSLIHSVDRFGLAEAIDRRARSLGITQQVLVEVNVAGESSKHGVEPPKVTALVREIARLEGVQVGGLMTIPALTADPDDARVYFRMLAELGADVSALVSEATDLSMGMSRDFEIAIEEGATLVRVGEAIFGSRA